MLRAIKLDFPHISTQAGMVELTDAADSKIPFFPIALKRSTGNAQQSPRLSISTALLLTSF
jgi:hypothetical protein